jgi:UDP-N-acetyl-D-galactosamine dehydrogenase
MGMFVANKVVKLMIGNGKPIKGANVLILGVTFKENCPDVRNTKVVDIYNELKQFQINVDIYDPWANAVEVKHEYNLSLLPKLDNKQYDAVIVAVAHTAFLSLDYKDFKKNGAVIFDTKACIDRALVDGRL